MKSQNKKELRLRNARNRCRSLHDAAPDRHARQIYDAMKADPLRGRSVADVRASLADEHAQHTRPHNTQRTYALDEMPEDHLRMIEKAVDATDERRK